MKRVKNCRTLLLGALFAGLGSMVFASPTKTATANVFTSDTDDIQNVTNFSGVKFDKWLAGSEFKSGSLDFGGAFNLGAVKISPWYKGWVVNSNSTNTNTKKLTDLLSGTYKNGESLTTTDNITGWNNLNNDFAVLVGINDFIGVKLGYSNADTEVYKGTYWSSKWDNETSSETVVTAIDGSAVSKSGTVYDPEGEAGTKVHKPYLEAGAKLKAGGITIKPKLGFAYRMSDEFVKTKKTNVQYPVSSGSYTTAEEYDTSNTTSDLIPSAAVSVIIGNSKEGLKHVIGLDWTGTFRSFDHDGSYKKFSTDYGTDPLADSVTTENITSYIDYDEQSYSKNSFNLSYKLEREIAEGLVLAGQVKLGCVLENSLDSSRNIIESDSVTKFTDGRTGSSYYISKGSLTKTEITTNTFTPSFAGGVKYNITEKVRFNGGVAVALPRLEIKETKKETPDCGTSYTKNVSAEGNVTESTSVNAQSNVESSDTKEASWTSAGATCYAGFTWFMSEKFNIDTAVTYSLGTSSLAGSSIAVGAVLKY